MTFIEACGNIYTRELLKDHEREIKEDLYLPQQAFSSCMGRAKGLSHNAERAVDNFRALCILIHREKTTDEKYNDEKTNLVVAMPIEDVQLAETQAWWHN